MLFLLFACLPLQSAQDGDLKSILSQPHPTPNTPIPIIRPTSIDLQIQLPLSEVADPATPLFTGRLAMQFDLLREVISRSLFSSPESHSTRIKLQIGTLDHFENVSLVYNNAELDIATVELTEDEMEIVVDQPILFTGRYSLSIQRYKGFIGEAVYYRDAGSHAVFGASLYPARAASLFPLVDPLTVRAPISLSIIHPLSTAALSTAPLSQPTRVTGEGWQLSEFNTSLSIPGSSLGFAILPEEYGRVTNLLTGIPLSVHFNSHRMQPQQAERLLTTTTQALGLLKSFFSTPLSISKLDIVIIQDIHASSSVGTFIIPEDSVLSADYANQILTLSTQLMRQWIGGATGIDNAKEICIQEDIITYIAMKIVKRMTVDENVRLAHMAKVFANEEFFQRGESLIIGDKLDELQLEAHCGLKGVIFLESLEVIIGEVEMLKRINGLVGSGSSFNLASLLRLFPENLDNGVPLSQVFEYWVHNGGMPRMGIERNGTSLQLSQAHQKQTVRSPDGENWQKMPLWPLPIKFSTFRLPVHLMISQSVHLAPVKDELSLTNLGFSHYYRTAYDLDTWREIRVELTENGSKYSKRERAQLIGDFCTHYATGELPSPQAERLLAEFKQLVRLRSNEYELCTVFAHGCGAGARQGVERPREPSGDVRNGLRRKLFHALSHSTDYGCGSGAVREAMNEICDAYFGQPCL